MAQMSMPRSLGTFFEQQAKRRTLRPQFIIAILAGIAFALDVTALYVLIGDEAANTYGPVLILLIIAYALVPFVGWFLGSVLVFTISRLLGAQMQFGIFYRTSGWGLIPMIGTGLCWGAGRFLALRGLDACSRSYVICDPGEIVGLGAQVNGIYALLATATTDPLFQGLYVLGLLFFAATVFSWILAADETSTLTRAGAAITVGVPALLVAGLYTVLTF